MAHSKCCLFTSEEQLFANYCKALAHPARKKIVDLLRVYSVLPLQSITEAVPLSISTIHDHLIRLERVGLVRVRQHLDGTIGYMLNVHAERELLDCLEEFLRGGG